MSDQYSMTDNGNSTGYYSFSPNTPRIFKIQLVNIRFSSTAGLNGWIAFISGNRYSGNCQSLIYFKDYQNATKTQISLGSSANGSNISPGIFHTEETYNDISLYFKLTDKYKGEIHTYLNGSPYTDGPVNIGVFDAEYLYTMLSPVKMINIYKDGKIDSVENIIISEVGSIGD